MYKMYKRRNLKCNSLIYALSDVSKYHLTVPGGVRNLLQVKEVRCQGDVSHLGVIKDLDSDSLSQRRKLLNEADLLVPNWTAGGAGDRCLPLQKKNTNTQYNYTILISLGDSLL